jgi:predicted NUDIX family NTP pyrophosphohydrolase
MTHVAAFATVLNDRGEVLVCHRRDLNLWKLPGGGVEDGETPWEAVIREIAEEPGCGSRSSASRASTGRPTLPGCHAAPPALVGSPTGRQASR